MKIAKKVLPVVDPVRVTQLAFVRIASDSPQRVGLAPVVSTSPYLGFEYERSRAVDMHYKAVQAAYDRMDPIPWQVLRDYPMAGFGQSIRERLAS
jgi:hypothetical protein